MNDLIDTETSHFLLLIRHIYMPLSCYVKVIFSGTNKPGPIQALLTRLILIKGYSETEYCYT